MDPTPLQGKQRDSFDNRCDDVLSNLHLCTLIIFTANFTETYHDHYSVLCGRSLSCKDEESNPGLPIVLEQLEWVEPACESIGGDRGAQCKVGGKLAKVLVQDGKVFYRFFGACDQGWS